MTDKEETKKEEEKQKETDNEIEETIKKLKEQDPFIYD